MAARSIVAELTPREVEVVLLIGREGLSYKEAAAKMHNLIVRGQVRHMGVTISHRTVRQYARGIRDKIGSSLKPTRALTLFYYEHRDELDEVRS